MMFNATFSNNSVILWQSVLFVEETEVPGENHRFVASHQQTLSHNVVSSTTSHERDLSCKSNYHTIMTTTTPVLRYFVDIRLVRRDIGVNEHEKVSNLTLRHKLKEHCIY